MGSETNDIVEELCESLLQKYPEGWETSMRWSEFIFDSVKQKGIMIYRFSQLAKK